MQRDASLLDPRTFVGASSGFARHVGRHDRGGEREGRSAADARRGRGLRGGAWVAMSDSDPRSRAGKQMPASDRPARILIMGPRVRAPENRGGKCVEGRAAFLGPRWDRLAYRGEIRCRGKDRKSLDRRGAPVPGGRKYNPRAARRRRPARLLSVSGPGKRSRLRPRRSRRTSSRGLA